MNYGEFNQFEFNQETIGAAYGVTTTTPPERTMDILLENRTMDILLENRTMMIY